MAPCRQTRRFENMGNILQYSSILDAVTAEILVKGSRFIATLHPCEHLEQALANISAAAQKFPDATHHCYAYKIGVGDQALFRYSDDGEPSGTAGRPIYQSIESKNVTNLVAVVTRYFGGVKLGTGGLIRAYSGATVAALEAAHCVVLHKKVALKLTFNYGFSNAVHQVVERYQATIEDKKFDESPCYIIELKQTDEAQFSADLRDLTKGSVLMETII